VNKSSESKLIKRRWSPEKWRDRNGDFNGEINFL